MKFALYRILVYSGYGLTDFMIQVKLFEIVIIFTHNAIILLNQKYSDEYFLHVSVGTILFASNIQSNLSNEKVVSILRN